MITSEKKKLSKRYFKICAQILSHLDMFNFFFFCLQTENFLPTNVNIDKIKATLSRNFVPAFYLCLKAVHHGGISAKTRISQYHYYYPLLRIITINVNENTTLTSSLLETICREYILSIYMETYWR